MNIHVYGKGFFDMAMKRRTKRLLLGVGLILLVIIVRVVWVHGSQWLALRNDDGKVHVIVSRETTFITEEVPFNEDGTVDYLTWLNRQKSRGVFGVSRPAGHTRRV